LLLRSYWSRLDPYLNSNSCLLSPKACSNWMLWIDPFNASLILLALAFVIIPISICNGSYRIAYWFISSPSPLNDLTLNCHMQWIMWCCLLILIIPCFLKIIQPWIVTCNGSCCIACWFSASPLSTNSFSFKSSPILKKKYKH
jgi:hypothetical protein